MTIATEPADEDGGAFSVLKKPGVRKGLRILVAVGVLCLAGFLLYRSFGQYDPAEIWRQATEVPMWRILAAGGFAAASYATLTLFDYLALRYAEKPLPYPKAALASFSSLSLGHTIGFAALSSGAIRYRFYSRWGLETGDVARVILFCGLTVGIGIGTLAAIALAFDPDLAMQLTGLGQAAVLGLAAAIAAVLVAYLATAAYVRKEIRIWRWAVSLPEPRLAMAQAVVGPINFAFVAACLHQTISAAGEAEFLRTIGAYALANVAALVSHVPGGLGVIETVVMTAIPGQEIVGGLLLFRLVYFLVPLAFGLTAFAASELAIRRARSPAPAR